MNQYSTVPEFILETSKTDQPVGTSISFATDWEQVVVELLQLSEEFRRVTDTLNGIQDSLHVLQLSVYRQE